MNQDLVKISERIRDHLLTQRAVSKVNSGPCLYRAPNGLKCAVGCLIADEHYIADFEGAGVSVVIGAVTLSLNMPPPYWHLIKLLSHWQCYHDGCLGEGNSYPYWLGGESTVGPAEFHERLINGGAPA
jgi:hypothetical protein